jgi:integrase
VTRFPNNDVGDLIWTEHDWVVVPDVLSGRRCLQRQGLVGECGLVYVQRPPHDVALLVRKLAVRTTTWAALPNPIARNPAAQVRRPGVERREAHRLDSEAVMLVLNAAEPSRYHAALVLIASTGLRKGEALALAWDRVDLDAGTLKVAATIGRTGGQLVISEPKTARSRRTVPLSPAVVAMLRKVKASQNAERLRAANQWQDSRLVFTTDLGRPVDPRNLLRVIEVAARSAGVAGVGVHTLRHSAAVAWLESGVHIKAVADLLGHSSIAITGDVYGHTSDDTARAAVDALAGRLGPVNVGGQS